MAKACITGIKTVEHSGIGVSTCASTNSTATFISFNFPLQVAQAKLVHYSFLKIIQHVQIIIWKTRKKCLIIYDFSPEKFSLSILIGREGIIVIILYMKERLNETCKCYKPMHNK